MCEGAHLQVPGWVFRHQVLEAQQPETALDHLRTNSTPAEAQLLQDRSSPHYPWIHLLNPCSVTFFLRFFFFFLLKHASIWLWKILVECLAISQRGSFLPGLTGSRVCTQHSLNRRLIRAGCLKSLKVLNRLGPQSTMWKRREKGFVIRRTSEEPRNRAQNP